MCQINENLTLCTCSEKIDTKQPHWRLYRKTIIQPVHDFDIVGMMIEPIGLSLNSSILLEQLNLRNCFNFDYQPLDEDRLVIKLTSEKLEFVYDGEDKLWVEEMPEFYETKRSMQAKGYVQTGENNQ